MSAGLPRRQIEPLPAFSDILRDHEVFGSGDSDDVSDKINTWFDNLMIQSGMQITPSMLLATCVFFGFVAGGMVFVIQENPLSAAMVAMMGAVGPIVTAIVIRQRRQNQMMAQLQAMIDELARAAKTGRSIEQCWDLVANDTGDPLGEELKECSRRMKMGESLGDALQALPNRTGLITLNILVTALAVHQQTGGDLVSVLERLSQTISDRLLFVGRLRAATTGSRATAVLMLALPPCIILFFSLRDPAYFSDVMASDMGRKTTFAAIIFQMIGTGLIMRILQSSQRS